MASGTKIDEITGVAGSSASSLTGVEGTAETDALDAVGSVDSSAGVDSVSAVHDSSSISAVNSLVLEGLSDGSMSIEQARDQLISDIVDRQLGPDAPRSVVESLSAELRIVLEGDPTINELLAPAIARESSSDGST